MSESPCPGFESQSYLKDRCKNCYRLRTKHPPPAASPVGEKKTVKNAETNGKSDSASRRTVNEKAAIAGGVKTEKSPGKSLKRTAPVNENGKKALREKAENGGEKAITALNNDDDKSDRFETLSTYSCDSSIPSAVFDEDPDNSSIVSFKSANSHRTRLSSATSLASVTSNNDTKSMATALSDSDDDDDRALTPTEFDTSDAVVFKRDMARLRDELSRVKVERERLRKELARGNAAGNDGSNFNDLLEQRLAEAETAIQDYRDENTALKNELRHLQEQKNATLPQAHKSVSSESDKLQAAEQMCEELLVENEALKADVKDLQQEIEEMQDQYREDEIEEFREMQRELETNAKNCRVLQFKLRKAERLLENTQSEKKHLEVKVKDLVTPDGIIVPANANSSASKQSPEAAARIRELETELRIAKEVSVRLHNELEATEEKRYRMEDETFYLKEKIRELQTQTKWRTGRSRNDEKKSEASPEAQITAPVLAPGGLDLDANLPKDMRDALERENDLREQLRFAEQDNKRTQQRLQDVENDNENLLRQLSKLQSQIKSRPPMLRSASEGQTQMQLEKVEHQAETLSAKLNMLERENSVLINRNKQLEDGIERLKIGGATNGDANVQNIRKMKDAIEEVQQKYHIGMTAEMQDDISRMMSKISELETRNLELSMQLKRRDANQALLDEMKLPAFNEKSAMAKDLRIEKERRTQLETEVNDLKAMLLRSDNQKMITMATKIELLTNQLKETNDRCTALHRRAIQGSGDFNYMDELKKRCETLERQLSEVKAQTTIADLQKEKVANADEIEQCCEVLASVEAQTSRIVKQIEKIEKIEQQSQKDERRRSLSKESGPMIIAELANVMVELKSVHLLLQANKIPGLRKPESPVRELKSPPPICKKCHENNETLEKLSGEIAFYKNKNKELTNQVLQTEDRWTHEIEKQRQTFETEIKKLQHSLDDSNRKMTELAETLVSKCNALSEKSRIIKEKEETIGRLNREATEKAKQLQEVENDRRKAREFEIKYQKLESLFDNEREKMVAERTKMKNENALIKKHSDEMQKDIDKLCDAHSKKEQFWEEMRHNLTAEMDQLKTRLGIEQTRRKSLETANSIVKVIHLDKTSTSPSAFSSLKEHMKNSSHTKENEELRKEIAALTRKLADSEAQAVTLRSAHENAVAQLTKVQANLQRDKETLQHKQRQDEKIRSVEIDALQQKFTSRMKIMEDTNKSLHTQLVQARRDRDHVREELNMFESRMADERQKIETKEKIASEILAKSADLEKQTADFESKIKRLETELHHSRDSHAADKKLWQIERSHLNQGTTASKPATDAKDAMIESALKAAETVQKQYNEYEQFYAKEVDRLNKVISELTNDGVTKTCDMQRTIKELREQIKVLEIDQRNLSAAKDLQENTREVLEAERERLQQSLHLAELHKLTRKYKMSAIVGQLSQLGDSTRSRITEDDSQTLQQAIVQLCTLREDDMQQSMLMHSDSFDMSTCSSSIVFPIGERLGPVGSESEAASDAVSQSSFSIRSSPMPPYGAQRQRFYAMHSSLTNPNRSYSIDGQTSWEQRVADIRQRSQSPRKNTKYPEAPPPFLLNKDKAVEYDKDGRLHIIPKIMMRSASDSVGPLDHAQKANDELMNNDGKQTIPRTSSAGANILYKIRREELARGGQPSVKLMASAFNAIDGDRQNASGHAATSAKKGLFGMRKSRSVEQTETGKTIREIGKNMLLPAASTSAAMNFLQRNRSVGNIEPLEGGGGSSSMTFIRGGRNPFKNMGTRLVERVRRSLSRSSSKDDAGEEIYAELPKPPMMTTSMVDSYTMSISTTSTIKADDVTLIEQNPAYEPKFQTPAAPAKAVPPSGKAKKTVRAKKSEVKSRSKTAELPVPTTTKPQLV